MVTARSILIVSGIFGSSSSFIGAAYMLLQQQRNKETAVHHHCHGDEGQNEGADVTIENMLKKAIYRSSLLSYGFVRAHA